MEENDDSTIQDRPSAEVALARATLAVEERIGGNQKQQIYFLGQKEEKVDIVFPPRK